MERVFRDESGAMRVGEERFVLSCVVHRILRRKYCNVQFGGEEETGKGRKLGY